MEILIPLALLGFLFLLFGGQESKDNKSEMGQEIIQSLSGPAKVAQENSGGCFIYGGLFIILVVVILFTITGGNP